MPYQITCSCRIGEDICAPCRRHRDTPAKRKKAKRKPIPKKQTRVWKAQDGDVRICDMSDHHLGSAIIYIEQRLAQYGAPKLALRNTALGDMKLELERRTRRKIVQHDRIDPETRKPKKKTPQPKISELLKDMCSEDRTAHFMDDKKKKGKELYDDEITVDGRPGGVLQYEPRRHRVRWNYQDLGR